MALKIRRYASSVIQSRPRLARALCLCLLAPAACKSEKSDAAAATASAEPLAAAAEHSEHQGKHELPPAAFDACQGKGLGDSCTATFGTKQLEAKCAAAPDGRLACRPERAEHKKPEGS